MELMKGGPNPISEDIRDAEPIYSSYTPYQDLLFKKKKKKKSRPRSKPWDIESMPLITTVSVCVNIALEALLEGIAAAALGDVGVTVACRAPKEGELFSSSFESSGSDE